MRKEFNEWFADYCKEWDLHRYNEFSETDMYLAFCAGREYQRQVEEQKTKK